MYIAYGGYRHQLNEASISINRTSIESDRNVIIGHQVQWQINGVLLADAGASDPVSNLTSKISALKNAYSVNGRDCALYEDDGTRTQHFIISKLTAQGVRVVNVSFPTGIGAEYATVRSYSITLTAEVITSAAARLGGVFFESAETISYTGTGGPRYVVRETRFGAPVRQLVSQATPCRVTQSGSIKTLGKAASPTPIYSNYEIFPARNITTSFSPKDRYYRVNYSFQFEAPHQL